MELKTSSNTTNRIFFASVVGILVYFSLQLAAGATLEDRRQFLAFWTMFAGAFFATSLPSALIPDARVPLHQLVNSPPTRLFAAQLRAWMPWMLSIMLPSFCLAFYDPGQPFYALDSKLSLTVANLLGMAVIGIYSFRLYYNIGPKSQKWQEGTEGGWYDKLILFDPRLRLPIPRGLVPALTATSHVFSISVLLAVAQLYVAQNWGPVHSIWPAALLALWTGVRVHKMRQSFDRVYYPTNAFYREVFQRGSLRAAEREPLGYDAVYWVPHRWRSHAWMSLLQLDRVLPMGRFIGIGLLIVWILVWRQIPPIYITAYLGALIASKNLASMLLNRQDLTPTSFRNWFQTKIDWGLTHFFINIRWTLPLFIGLISLGWVHPGFSVQQAGVWILIDLVLSLLFGFFVARASNQNRKERVHG